MLLNKRYMNPVNEAPCVHRSPAGTGVRHVSATCVCICVCAPVRTCTCIFGGVERSEWRRGRKSPPWPPAFSVGEGIHLNAAQQEQYSVKQEPGLYQKTREFLAKPGGEGESRWMFLINNQPNNNLYEVYSVCQTYSINKALVASSKHLPLENYFYETYITDKALGLYYCTFAFLKKALCPHRGIVYSRQRRNFRCCSSELAML